MHIFFLGYPGNMGGANTECLHTAAVWRAAGIDVTFIPTWGRDADMEQRLAAMGCKTLHAGCADNLHRVPDFAGATVVGMCNANVSHARGILRELRCRLVWLNCMTFLFSEERAAFHQHGPAEAYIFQSEFQRAELEPQLVALGYAKEQGHLIRGAFDFDAIPFRPRPHRATSEFVVGRLARPDADKWSSNHWRILDRMPYANRRGLAMGFNPATRFKVGAPPAWAQVYAPQQLTVCDFLGRCHAMLGLNGGARENWPRIGLESMAAGVPLVAQNLWGWREMIRHGETGFLVDGDEEMEYRLAQLAYDEELRMRLIHAARERVEEIADPAAIGRQWVDLFVSLGA